MSSTVFLHEVGAADVRTVGGKGANLGELMGEAFPVPPGFVVTANCYREFIGQFELPSDLESLAQLRQLIVASDPPASLIDEIERCDATLQQDTTRSFVYAVRSSATAEDLADASFAGQHETYYYVTKDTLALMVRKCWASLWSDAAWSYRTSKGIGHQDVDMAVIVQRMVQSDVSGVTFTADPVSGSDNVIITESCWGMGAALVDGRVSPDQYVTDKKSGYLTSIKIADKKFMVPASLSPEATSRLIPVPSHLRRVETLTDDQARVVSDWATKSADHFQCNQDLEWAFEDGNFYMLQSRPITVIGQHDEDIPKGKYVLFKPLAENFTDPMLPLSRDMLSKLLPIGKFIYGRLYLPFAIFRAILPFRISDQDVAKLAYLSNVDSPRLSIWRLVPLALILGFNYLEMTVLYYRLDNLPNDFMAPFRKKVRRVVEDPSIDAPEAMRTLFATTRFFEPVGNMVLMNNLASIRYVFLIPVMDNLLRRWMPEMRSDAASFLCSGDPEILSTDMGRRIWRLSQTARINDDVKGVIVETTPGRVLAKLDSIEGAGPFRDELDEFLVIHGHRSLKEFELNSARWEEDPAPVIAMIRNYLLSDIDPETTEKRVAGERAKLWREIEARLPSWKLRIITTIAKNAKYLIRMRENSRFYHIMCFYAARKKILETEALLLASGRLKCKDDIFYLTWNEVESLRDNRMDWHDIEDVIRQRRMDHIRLGKMTAPKTIGVDVAEEEAVHGDTLNGQGASPGVYEGIARVIMDPAVSAELLSGEILVAPYTDPAWTPLFLTAHAAVVEVGSYLSHAGTIAREYGMPCVVDVADCTKRIKTGDRIRVDGTVGQVTLLVTLLEANDA